MNNATPEFDGSAWVHRHIMSHFIAAPNSKPPYYLGKVTEAIPPSEDGQPWTFRVAYEDGPDASLNRNDLEADLLPVRPDNTHAIEETRDWIFLKKTKDSIHQHLLTGPLDHRSEPCMRSIFGFQAGTPITQKNVKQRLHKRSKRLHPDKTTQRPARVKHLAKKIYYALNYLHDSMIQDSWAANDRTVDDPPTIDEYPAYHTEAFAKAASTATERVTLEDLTPGDADEDPQHGSHDDDSQDAYDDNLNDQHGPTAGNPSALRPDGTIDNTLQGIDALPLEDFLFSNLQHVVWVPRNCLRLWGEVFSDITGELVDAIKSSGPTRQQRIGTAARWYLGLPQIFLRDPGRGCIRNAETIHLRLVNFLEGNYATLLNEWSAAKAKARKKAKPPKPDTKARRTDRCIKLFHQGFLSRGLRMITGNGRADADNPKIIQQMQGKHPVEYWPHASWPIGEEPDLTSNIAAVVMNTKPPS